MRERLHCLQSGVPQLLQGKESDEPQPDEYLHISYYLINLDESLIKPSIYRYDKLIFYTNKKLNPNSHNALGNFFIERLTNRLA